MFTGGFELYVPGPGCVSTSPIIRINSNTNKNGILSVKISRYDEITVIKVRNIMMHTGKTNQLSNLNSI